MRRSVAVPACWPCKRRWRRRELRRQRRAATGASASGTRADIQLIRSSPARRAQCLHGHSQNLLSSAPWLRMLHTQSCVVPDACLGEDARWLVQQQAPEVVIRQRSSPRGAGAASRQAAWADNGASAGAVDTGAAGCGCHQFSCLPFMHVYFPQHLRHVCLSNGTCVPTVKEIKCRPNLAVSQVSLLQAGCRPGPSVGA